MISLQQSTCRACPLRALIQATTTQPPEKDIHGPGNLDRLLVPLGFLFADQGAAGHAASMACDLPAHVIRCVTKELTELQKTPCEGIRVILNEQNVTDVQAEIDGPTGTPYEGGLFRMKLVLGSDFPNSPPKGYFLTKIWHPNVSKTGNQ